MSMSEKSEKEQEGKEGKEAKKGKKEKKEKKPKKEKAKKPKKEKKEKPIKTKICPACHQEIPKKAKNCPHCAAKQKGNPLPLILAVVLTLVLAAGVSVMIFHFPFTPPFSLPFTGKPITETVLGRGMELTKKQDAAVTAVLEECGFKQISEVKIVSSDEHGTSYNVNDVDTIRFLDHADELIVQVNNETKAVERVTYQKTNIYINGHLIEPITKFYLDAATRDVYLSATLTAVRARLDLPETAEFPSRSNWRYTMDGENVTVESTVTSKTNSGEMETRSFLAKFEKGSFVSITLEKPGGADTPDEAGETGGTN